MLFVSKEERKLRKDLKEWFALDKPTDKRPFTYKNKVRFGIPTGKGRTIHRNIFNKHGGTYIMFNDKESADSFRRYLKKKCKLSLDTINNIDYKILGGM